ncbi:hypothetical protein HDU76_002276 [Blyttiomyces sp. JEL0837]|nr:hypothetical protein HDU76_002276 [Blyttiomyces sp. JEL0837]
MGPLGFQLKLMKDVEQFAGRMFDGGLQCPKYTLNEVCIKSRFDRRGATRETVIKVIDFLVERYLNRFNMMELFSGVWYYPDFVVEYVKEREMAWCNGVVNEVEEPTDEERWRFENVYEQPWIMDQDDL